MIMTYITVKYWRCYSEEILKLMGENIKKIFQRICKVEKVVFSPFLDKRKESIDWSPVNKISRQITKQNSNLLNKNRSFPSQSLYLSKTGMKFAIEAKLMMSL